MTRRHASFPETAPAYWGARASEYDAFIRRVVPRYDEMTARLMEYLPHAPAAVLELGCGTGNLSVRLVEHAPRATFAFVDAAPEMVQTTRTRLDARFPDAVARCRFLAVPFEDLRPEPGAFDLVVSSLSLHHVAEPGPVYRRVRGCLAPGGALRIADGYGAASAALHAIHWTRWQAFWREPGHLTEEEARQVLEHAARHDHYTPIGEHFRLLEEAGFTSCDCVWRDGLFAILTAEVG